MSKILKSATIIVFMFFVSCSSTEKMTTYIPVPETTEPYDLDGDRVLISKEIEMLPKKIINTVTNDSITIVHHLESTGFHFYNAVAFSSEKKGVLVGGGGLRIRTTIDGGLHWQENRFLKFGDALHSVALHKDTIFAVGELKYIYRSTDFGEHWKIYNPDVLFKNYLDNKKPEDPDIYDANYYKIKFHNNIGIIVGDYNEIFNAKPILLKTIDKGGIWKVIMPKGLKDTEKRISDIVMFSEKIFFIVTAEGSCYKSIDGGSNWKLLFSDQAISLNSIDFINENEGYIGGMSNKLLSTKDGGKTWQSTNLDLDKNLNITNIKFINDKKMVLTIASQYANVDLLYEIETKTNTLRSLLKTNDSTVTLEGEPYGLYKLKNSLYVLDRNNLYKMELKE